MASTRESWTGVAGAVRAVAYHAGITWADVSVPRDATRPKDPEEEGAALVNLMKAEVENLVVLGLLPGDAPAQVDVYKFDPVGGQPLA